MKTIEVKVSIRNPDYSEDINVQQFSSLREAIDSIGEKRVLDIINSNLITICRAQWRNRIINQLMHPTLNLKKE